MPESQRLPLIEEAPRAARCGYFEEVSRNIFHTKHIHEWTELPTCEWRSKTLDSEGECVFIDAIAVAVKEIKVGDMDLSYSRGR